MRALAIGLFLLAFAWSVPAQADEEAARPLIHNPFTRPALLEKLLKPKNTPAANRKPAIQKPVANTPPPEPPWEPELRGTLVAKSGSVANLGGVILSPGEEIEGHVLVEVREREAVFEKGPKSVLVSMDEATVELAVAEPGETGPPESEPSPLGEEEPESPEGQTASHQEDLPDEAAPAEASQIDPPSAGGETGGADAALLEDRVLQVGVYRSQRYLRDTEQKLTSLGIPHFRAESTRRGVGHRVAVDVSPGTPAEKTRDLLVARGYLFRQAGGRIEVFFYLQREAQKLLRVLSEAGMSGESEKLTGDLPRWTLYAGPFSQEQALEASEKLASAGMTTHVKKRSADSQARFSLVDHDARKDPI